ncbi:transposase (plasmid) [Paraburkholderia sp. D15]|uniref:transposase n=1 Tax=Paraburkholderia sp. D15 TaxID=2880218 RepID=UPI00247A0AA7|nr:transposase [Paraburkholderia sp. D15]WGS55005.1 transposase [Paraburkholderia sp. D15]
MLSVRVDTCTQTMMTEKQELRSRLVVGHRRDGRREFDEDAVRELVEFCLKPGVSIARAAMDHDVNPNQLRRWISRHQQHTLQTPTRPDPLVIDGVSIDIPGTARRVPMSEAQTFVPVVTTASTVPVVSAVLPPAPSLMALSLHVRLSNGVEFDLGEASVDELATVIQMLGRLPCSGSTKG